MNAFLKKICILPACLLLLAGCDSVDDMRIPSVNVFLDLGNAGLWNTYGVHGYGECRMFNRENRIPDNFPYIERSATGYGGIMLVYGINEPGSRFNVCDAGGVPVSGEAVDRKYGLQQFRVIATNGGYVITR